MSTINELVPKVRVKLRDNYLDIDSVNEGSAWGSAATVLQVSDGTKFTSDRMIEIEDEVIYIQQIPYLVDYLNESSDLAASATAITVETSASFAADDLIKMDNEVMKVSKVSAMGSSNMKVSRGERDTAAAEHYKKVGIFLRDEMKVQRAKYGSSAVSHADGTDVNLVNGFTDFEVKDSVKRGIRNLFPDVYIDFVGSVGREGDYYQLDDCDAADWTEADDAGAESVNTSDETEGTACLDLSATYSAGTASYTKTLGSTVDISDYYYLLIDFYIKELQDSDDNWNIAQNALIVRLGNDSSNYLEWTVSREELEEEDFITLNLNIEDASKTGTVDKTAVDYLYIDIKDLQSMSSGELKMDNWRVTTYPITNNKRRIRLPKGVFGVNQVRLIANRQGEVKRDIQSWEVQGDYNQSYLIFNELPPKDYPLEIMGRQMVTVPDDNTTEISLDDTAEEIILLEAAINAFDSLMADRVRFDQYVSKVEKTGNSRLDVFRAQNALKIRLAELRNKFSKPVGAVDLDWSNLNNG